MGEARSVEVDRPRPAYARSALARKAAALAALAVVGCAHPEPPVAPAPAATLVLAASACTRPGDEPARDAFLLDPRLRVFLLARAVPPARDESARDVVFSIHARAAGSRSPADVARALAAAGDALHAQRRGGAAVEAVALRVEGALAHLAWAGSSSVYVVGPRRAFPVNVPHDALHEGLRSGAITLSALRTMNARTRAELRATTTRALGLAPGVEVEHAAIGLVPGTSLVVLTRAAAMNLDETKLAKARAEASDAASLLAAIGEVDGEASALVVRALAEDEAQRDEEPPEGWTCARALAW